jgi:branched-chain amino acid transport system substrate-binding protein
MPNQRRQVMRAVVRTALHLILSLPVVLALGCGSADTGPVRLGIALSITEAGTVPMKRGAELAAAEINAAGGINGRPLELVMRDDHGDADSGIALAQELYDSDVPAVIAGAYSSVALAAAPVYNGGRRPLVQLSPSASSPLLSQAGRYTFRLCPSDLAYGAALAQAASDRGWNRVAILYVNDAYGRGVRQTFVAEFSRLGGEVVELDPFLASSPDVGAYLKRMQQEKRVQAVVLAANQDEGLSVLRELRAARLNVPILAADGMSGAERTNPALMEGTLVSSGYIALDPEERNLKFVQAYRKRFPEAGWPDQGAAATYDAVHLLATVIGAVGTDRERVRDRLAATGSTAPAFIGVVGRVAFDSAGDVPSVPVRVGRAKGGLLVLE